MQEVQRALNLVDDRDGQRGKHVVMGVVARFELVGTSRCPGRVTRCARNLVA